MTPTQKKKLLTQIEAGMDSDSACAVLGISASEITNASKRFAAQIDEAVRSGSARLRGRLFKNALRDDDTKYLQDLLDRRANAGANQAITRIERVVIDMTHCPRCKHQLVKMPGAAPPKRTNGQAAHE